MARLNFLLTGGIAIAQAKEARINNEITVQEVRLLGVEGEQHGVVSLAKALEMAQQAEVDLVEIAPTAKPPVCRLMDYGKFKYRESKKQHEAKLKQRQIQVKEIKFRPGTGEGDYQVKLRNLIRFLKEGDKAKVTLRFRGRELAHQELGTKLLKRVEADLTAYGMVEQYPKMEGKQLIMVLSPIKHKPGAGRKPAAAKPATAATKKTAVRKKVAPETITTNAE